VGEDEILVWEVLGEYQGPPSFKLFARYLIARFIKSVDERVYRTYVTDSLRAIPQMAYLPKRWVEIREMMNEPERSADEIIDEVASRLEGS